MSDDRKFTPAAYVPTGGVPRLPEGMKVETVTFPAPVCEVCGKPATEATLREIRRFVDLSNGGYVMQPHGGYAFRCGDHPTDTETIDMGAIGLMMGGMSRGNE